MKQSQFSSFRASKYPTFSSFALLNLALSDCKTRKENNACQACLTAKPPVIKHIYNTFCGIAIIQKKQPEGTGAARHNIWQDTMFVININT